MKNCVWITLGCLLGGAVTGFGQAKVWTGSGDGVSWSSGANWQGGAVPGAANDVFITNGLGSSVTFASGNVTVKSLRCTRPLNLSGGSLTLTAGASTISGTLTVADGASLTVDGSGASLTASGSAVIVGDLNASDGGVFRFPNLTTSSTTAYTTTWRADGAGSLLDLSALTSLGVGANSRIYVQAYNGGTVDLQHLTTLTNALWVDAQDADSLVNLSGLAGRYQARGNYGFQFKAQGGATVRIPNVTQMANGELVIKDTGVIPTAQLNLLTNVELTVDGAAPNFNALTNVDDTSIYVYNGGQARLPGLVRGTMNAYTTSWHAEDSDSLLDVSSVTNLFVGANSRLYLQAYEGGQIDLHRLTTKTNALWVDAQDAGSLVDLSGLAGRYTAKGNYELALKAQDGATVRVPNLTQFDNATLRIVNDGVIPTAQMNLLTNVELTLDGATTAFTALTNVDGTSIYALNGGVVRLPNVVRSVMNAYTTTWQANNSGSLIDASSLTTLAVGANSRLYLQAYNGGQIDLHRLTTKTNALWVDAQDAGSLVDLSGLAGRYTAGGNYELSIKATGGATVLVPNVTQLDNATISMVDSGVVSSAQLTLLTNVTLTVDASVPDFNRVTNINDTSIYALNGGIARLTNVTRGVMSVYTTSWQANSAGSLIDVSAITNLAVGANSRLYLQAYEGGKIDLHRLTTKTNALWVDAQDAGSVVDLSGLAGRYSARGNYELQLSSQDGASVLVPNLTQVDNATIRFGNGGQITSSQWNLMTNVEMTVQSATPSFASLTNIDDTAIYATDGGVANLTNVARMSVKAYTITWRAEDSGSLINLSNLIDVVVAENSRLFVEARSGGRVDLHRLSSLSTGGVLVTADGTGSVVDLRGVTAFISSGDYDSGLTAKSGGSILFNDQAFLLANVAINIPSGNPLLPSTLIASPTLTLYGKPWHSYWIEKRDTRLDLNPWVFAARVPLTNSFQPFAPAPLPNTEFRLFEFVANPPILDLVQAANRQYRIVLYGTPNTTAQVLSKTDLLPPATWQYWSNISMTNSFRIFPPAPPTDPKRFFKATQL